MQNTPNKWNRLLNDRRRKKDATSVAGEVQNSNKNESRTEIERDYDRILFSTPVRRLADKTQVFPLDKNDSVRTRLTHSHEVSNLARSIGTALIYDRQIQTGHVSAARDVPAILATVGLLHDLGNPPFGHQGEAAIQSWFVENSDSVLGCLETEQQRQDFLKFEGNAQAFRLVTRLQLINDDFGLDLTYASLAAMMKYPTASDQTDSSHVAKKKHGFFASEEHVVKQVHSETGLSLGQRHPLTYVMEACDDIAYVVLDAEDAVKKGLASFSDLLAYLEMKSADDPVVKKLIEDSKAKHKEYRNISGRLSPSELNDVSMQRFRVYAIGQMVKSSVDAFMTHNEQLVSGTLEKPLLAVSDCENLRKQLKDFSVTHAYNHRSVLEIELTGFNVIRELMDIFWMAIIDREKQFQLDSKRQHPFTRYVYSRISENYRRIFENPTPNDRKFGIRYRECLLLTDMISGMTDSYALNLHADLLSRKGSFDCKNFARGS
ncbi:dGTP triphosphohydrolase [uncultured Pseudacidovorax sp.]|uniref:dGTP triphosphohydrolase n=1 Tax=uncultured Pseudacidovorax sp. TaxID=679313 RepID=UPI0025F389AD|nr:dNTP triphosphohydrolase [uncultured Pseudacidovorax sp.]